MHLINSNYINNNSALGGHRAVLKVANERFCNTAFLCMHCILHVHALCNNSINNNSALCDHRAVLRLKVANERYCNIVFILCLFVHVLHAESARNIQLPNQQ